MLLGTAHSNGFVNSTRALFTGQSPKGSQQFQLCIRERKRSQHTTPSLRPILLAVKEMNQQKPVTQEEVYAVANLLARAYPGVRERKAAEGVLTDPPLESLVRAVLSQNTTDVNRDRAFASLREHFPKWEEILEAPTEQVMEAVRPANYSYTKAQHIQQILRQIREERGGITLDFLRDWPTERILKYLDDFPGVGRKSAAVVSLFSLGRPVIPVDTHVYRVSQRLGWIGEKITPERAHDVLQELIPPELIFPLHTGMWEHGRVTCRPKPRCGQCAIYRYCIYPAKTAPMPSVEEAIAVTAG